MSELRELLRHPGIWQGLRPPSLGDVRSGFAELDRHLPGRGWPRDALIELLPARPGIGELQLLLPTLRPGRQAWVNPPRLPYAPGLAGAGLDLRQILIVQPPNAAEALWALEQLLRSGLQDCVLGWLEQADMRQLRRLQLAAEAGGCQLFLFRPAACARQPSPAALRLYLDAAEQGLYIRILKCRGGRPARFIQPLPDAVLQAPAKTSITRSIQAA